ncbi:hypothetical protein B0H63DRAFT_489645 [Podospora didyma]|uniref:Uncharacterized protein n=1 Tax=Podospora didyma TaxID=330526 RepID=A0AAE0K119_9PEZI|nr:hypothetical protein B0H63DRAFT_489645 [Podospora didyma]
MMASNLTDLTLLNPHNVTKLADLRISYLTELLLNYGNNVTRDGSGCLAASSILPLSNLTILHIVEPGVNAKDMNLTVNLNPASLDVGLLDLKRFASQIFPSPINGSRVGDIAEWWTNATTNDAESAQNFLGAVVNMCGGTYCRSGYINIGNPDIVGIGMLVAVGMLLFLAFVFSLMSLGPLVDIVANPSPRNRKKHFNFRASCVGTVDELFSAVFVFAIAVLVSTFVFRYKTEARFDALMADGLSMFCSTAVIMLAASYWAHNEQRPHATISVCLIAILTIVLFATHSSVANMHASPAELACGTGKGRVGVLGGDPFDIKKFRFIPVAFGSWCLALIGAVFHHPFVNKYKPDKERRFARVMWQMGESLASVFGFIGLVIYAIYFFNTWKMMKETYGEAFTKGLKNWGFGQYLAVFTWLPPLLTFMHLFLTSMEGVFESRLPKGFKVFRSDSFRVDSQSRVELVNMPSRQRTETQSFNDVGKTETRYEGYSVHFPSTVREQAFPLSGGNRREDVILGRR